MTDSLVEDWIKSCVIAFDWTPHYCIESLYLDDMDFYGLKYWHDVAMEIDNSIRNTKPEQK